MWTITLIAVLIVLWLLYRRKNFSVFKELGIPGPEPNLLFGNLLEIYRKDPIKCTKEWLDKYGKVVGYFYGTEPVVLITDVELLKKIQVSDFQKFINRPNIFRGVDNSSKKPPRREGVSQQLTRLRDKRWKEIRSILTPSFTTSKMKQMTPIINDAINSLLKNVQKKSEVGESFDIYGMYQTLTLDIIGRTAFGIQTDVQNNPNDLVFRSAKTLFSGSPKNLFTLIAASSRKLAKFWHWVGMLNLTYRNKGINPLTEVTNSVKDIISLRRRDKSTHRPDLLQLMIDAEADDSSITSDDLTATDEQDTQEKKAAGKRFRKMTDDDILDNSVLFFLAGYETTSAALAFTTHLLLHHQDVQEKVRQEILELSKKEGELDYYSVNKLQYLDQVLHEALRIYPPIYLFVSRECGEDVDFGKFKLKKGLSIQIPVYNLHRDSDLWPEPEKFIPERFSPENKAQTHPLAYQPFGAGPRNCVGMRFALMEAKLALSKLLLQYKLKPCEQTDKEPISLKLSLASMTPEKGIHLKAIPVGLTSED